MEGRTMKLMTALEREREREREKERKEKREREIEKKRSEHRERCKGSLRIMLMDENTVAYECRNCSSVLIDKKEEGR